MKYLKQLSKLLLISAVVFTGCEGAEDSLINDRLEGIDTSTPSYSTGDADFSNYVAIGNSLTAGYMDGALYNDGQQNSIAALMNSQFEMVGGTTNFMQPDIGSEDGFNTAVENPQNGVILGRFKLDTSIPAPSPVVTGDPIAPYGGTASDLNNFGVPGIQVGQLLTPATGGPASAQNPAYNPFYARFASNPSADGQSGSTILGDAISAAPTFISLWIGNNDVLGYAASGGSNPAILTSDSDFDTRFNAVVNTLMASTSAKGVVANIPPLLGTPLFQAVPYNAIPLTSQAQVDALNDGYAQYNAGVEQARLGGAISDEEAARRTISFSLGANAFVMEDETLTDLSGLGIPSWRQSESTDLVLISAATAFATGTGTQSAAGDELVLLPSEQQEIEIKRATFNGMIAAAVANYPDRLALYDANAADGVFLDLFGISDGELGIRVSGTLLQPDFSPNGVVSTDGVHPNQRGNALLVNDMLRTIEEAFNAELPRVDVLNLPSVEVCTGLCASEQGT